jgi:hypothetical protein
MKTRSFLAASTLIFAVAVAPAYAQATRTWVSGVGDDANPCSRTAPCKTFAGAISKTAPAGEISVLDPGGFGAVTITKSITINGDGTLAGILSSLTTGVIINALPTDRVVLRNISINGAGNGITGIRVLNAGHVVVDHVTMTGFTTAGIDVAPNTANSVAVYVQDSTITGVPTGVKVVANIGGGTAVLALEGVEVYKASANGVELGANSVRASIKGSSFTHSASAGILISGNNAHVDVDNTVLAFNNFGLNLTAAGTARIAGSQFFNNSFGVNNPGAGSTLSNLQNTFAGNSNDGAFGGPLTVK